jgi:hypothetical protein
MDLCTPKLRRLKHEQLKSTEHSYKQIYMYAMFC